MGRQIPPPVKSTSVQPEPASLETGFTVSIFAESYFHLLILTTIGFCWLNPLATALPLSQHHAVLLLAFHIRWLDKGRCCFPPQSHYFVAFLDCYHFYHVIQEYNDLHLLFPQSCKTCLIKGSCRSAKQWVWRPFLWPFCWPFTVAWEHNYPLCPKLRLKVSACQRLLRSLDCSCRLRAPKFRAHTHTHIKIAQELNLIYLLS